MLDGSRWIWSSGLQSFEAWQIAATTKPSQWFAHYVSFDQYVSFDYVALSENRGENIGRFKMSEGPMISAASRKLVLATFASLVLATASTAPSAATSSTLPAKAVATKAVATGSAASSVTDFSAARRHRYYRRGPNNAAGLAFMGVAAGLIGGAIAESRRQEYYEDHYYYGGQRPYYGGQGYYGGGGPYYGQRGYYQPY
jgi:hypothetical protein